MRHLFFPLVSFCLLFQLSCSKGVANGESRFAGGPAVSTKNSLTIAEVSDGKCLNVPRYGFALHNLNPYLFVLRASTHFSLDSNHPIRPNFRILTAYATFQFAHSTLGQLTEFDSYKQEGCEKLVHTGADGTQELYKVVESTPETLHAESANGKALSYRWLSPQSFELRVRYVAYDYPCTDRSAFVDLTRVFDWSGSVPQLLERERSAMTVDDDYLSLVADAVDYDRSQLYADAPAEDPAVPPRRVLLRDRVLEMAKRPVRDSLLSCNGEAPPPPPNDDESPPPPEDGDPPPTDDLPHR